MCNWVYGPNEIGKPVITASDRELTAFDIEYEPAQLKVSFLTKRAIILVAAEYTIHSEALQQTQRKIIAPGEAEPSAIAEMYAAALRNVRFRNAANIYLSPQRLDYDLFTHASMNITNWSIGHAAQSDAKSQTSRNGSNNCCGR